MSKIQPKTPREPIYAFYYPEGAGYLHVRELGKGTQGHVTIVKSCADGQFYVRKRGGITRSAYKDDHGSQLPIQDISTYRIHRLIPRLIDWTVYKPLPRHNPAHHQFTVTTSVWELCKLGDLNRLVQAYRKANLLDADLPSGNPLSPVPILYPLKSHIPEAFIWKTFGQLVQVVSFLHQAMPGVVHNDLFSCNIFLDRQEGSVLPDTKLGDFGKSVLVNLESWNRKGEPMILDMPSNHGVYLMYDYRAIIRTIKLMMTLDLEHDTTDSVKKGVSGRLNETFRDLQVVCCGGLQTPFSPQRTSNGDFFYASEDELDYREKWREQNRHLGKLYSPELFDAVNQFEKRIAMVQGEYVDTAFFPGTDLYPSEKCHNRDWTYLGEKFEAKASQRLDTSGSTIYPSINQEWRTIIDDLEYDLAFLQLQSTMIHDRQSVIDPVVQFDVSGPFRIARLDPDTFEVAGLSEKTYHTNEPPCGLEGEYSIVRQVKGNEQHSVAADPTQVGGTCITRQLNESYIRYH